jgi:hypothetical protein
LTRPDSGLYPDVVDYDGDGDLDLIVGGYSIWTPKGRNLNQKEQAHVQDLKAKHSKVLVERVALSRQRNAEIEKATAGLKKPSEPYKEKRAAVAETFSERFNVINQKEQKLQGKLQEFAPTKQRKAFVWLYERM